MKVSSGKQPGQMYSQNLTCYSCGNIGHKAADCRVKKKRWCDHCKNHTHDTKWCRKQKKESVKGMTTKEMTTEEQHAFCFKVNVDGHKDHGVNGLLVDCGATVHIMNGYSKFVSLEDDFNPANHYRELANGTPRNNVAQGRGTVSIRLFDSEGNPHKLLLEKALYVPSYKQSIFSVQVATQKGACVNFQSNGGELVAPDGTTFDIQKRGRLYYLNSVCTSEKEMRSLEEWHKTLGHCNTKDILHLENVVEGMKVSGKGEFQCGTCVEGKMAQFRNRKPDARATSALELVHCDLAGPKDGFRYALSFVDDYSSVIMIYFLRAKSDCAAATEKFLADCAPFGNVKTIRSDNGTEFTSKEFESLLVKNQIRHEKSAPYSPHQNGTVERTWRSLFDMARCLLLESKLPKELWTYAAYIYISAIDVTTLEISKPRSRLTREESRT